MRVATLGPEGTFSHQAAAQIPGVHLIFANSIEDVFDLIQQEICDLIVVPIENSVSGTVFQTLDLLQEEGLKIQGEILLNISHHLASFIPLDKITRLYTHPHSFEQCRSTIKKILSKHPHPETLDIIYTPSNALSAKQLLAHKDSAGALINEKTARLHQIPFIEEKCEDKENNQTRFLIIGTHIQNPTGQDRTSLMLLPQKNHFGQLAKYLEIFAKYQINLTKIESRPSQNQLGEYTFFLECEGHVEDQVVRKALKELEFLVQVKFLGSYPRKF